MPVRLLATLIAALACAGAGAADVQVAVAANFTAPAQRIAADFERDTGHHAALVFGSTGTLYAQIRHGAPFEVLLAADDATPLKLEREGAAVPGSRFTYAIGQLVLWSPDPQRVGDGPQVLRAGRFRHLAIANPKLAPYGAAAVETLRALQLLDSLQPRLVQGESIAQAHQFVASGNAELGFVALSQVMSNGQLSGGSAWLVPARYHAPIRQEAVLLEAGHGHAAAQAWLRYLKSGQAQAVMRAFGYALP